MPSTTLLAGRGVNSGTTANWTNPGNITAKDNTYAAVSLTYGSATTSVSVYLRADQFGFSIPSTATIDGIVCTVQRYASSASTIRDYAVQLLKNGSVPSGSDDKKDTGTYWSTSEGDVSYGSPSDLWNATWSPSDINNTGTGFAVRCEYVPAYGGASAYIDSMEMTVYYTVDGIKFGTTSVAKAYYGSTEIKAVYYGTTQIF